MLGLEEGSLPRRARTLAVPRRRPPPRARRRGSSAPTRSAATATSSTRRARARRGGSTSSARRRPTTARRASRARSGRRSPRSSTPEDVERATRAAAALRAHLADRGARRPSASGCARSRRLSADATRRRALARVAEANGWARRLGRARARVRAATRGSATRRARAARRADDVRRHRARALRRLLVGLALRARRRPEDDRRRGRPDAARQGRPPGALQVLRGPAEGARRRPRHAGEPRAGASGSSSAASTTRSRGGVRLELERASQAAELREGLCRDLERLRPRRGRSRSSRFVPRRFEVGVRHRPLRARAAARARARRRPLPQRQDRPHRRRPVQRARDRAGLQVGQGRALGAADRRGAASSRSRSTCSCCATSSASSRSAASTARSPGSRGTRGHAARRGARRPARASARTTTSTRSRSGRRSRRRASARSTAAQRIRAGDVAPRPEGRRVPVLVRPLDDVPGGARRERAAARGGRGARRGLRLGRRRAPGKTAVLVERFVRAVCDEGLDVDSVLVITYTRKAAGELRARIRAALRRARPATTSPAQLDGAWISTIHGFCARLLRAHPFAVGIDPRFHELDDEHGAVLRGEAFERALAAFCAAREPGAARGCSRPTAAPRPAPDAHRRLRDAPLGRPRRSTLELGEQPAISTSASPSCARPRSALLDDPGATENQRRRGAGGARRSASTPEQLLDLAALAARGDRGRRASRTRASGVEQAALESSRARDRELLQELLDLFAAEYAAGEGARVGARLRGSPALRARPAARPTTRVREAEQLRFRAIMVDEFQDTNALQCELIDLLARRAREKDVFFVGDEFQSIYGFRHADVGVFRERRERGRAAAAADARTTARGPRCSPRSTTSSARSSATATSRSRRRASSPTRCSGIRSSCSSPTSAAYRDSRRALARGPRRGTIARRVRELVDAGAATPGEIVLLFAAGTDAEWYEEELRALGPARPTARPGRALLRPAAGRRPAHVPAAAAQPLRRRGARRPCSPRRSSASRTTRSC